MLASRANIIAVSPQLASPVRASQARKLSIQLSGSNALEYLYNPARCHLGMGTAEQVNMIFVITEGFHFDGIPLSYFFGCFLYDIVYFRIQ